MEVTKRQICEFNSKFKGAIKVILKLAKSTNNQRRSVTLQSYYLVTSISEVTKKK